MELTPVTSGMIEQSGGMQQIGLAMLGKQLDTSEASAATMVAAMNAMPSMETLVNPSVGSNFDMRI